jgi:hypothetical protein
LRICASKSAISASDVNTIYILGVRAEESSPGTMK